MQQPIKIALVGNPNSGKSSLFNALTGLNQKVGNFPGVTVDKKSGAAHLPDGSEVIVIDLPGTYSLYPKSSDEFVTYDLLINPSEKDKPDIVVIIADASNLKRNLLFCSQIIDLKIPVIIALTMMDIAQKRGIEIEVAGLERELGVPIVPINPRKNKGIQAVKKAIVLTIRQQYQVPAADFIDNYELAPGVAEGVKKFVPVTSDYAALHVASNYEEMKFLNAGQRLAIRNIIEENHFNKTKIQGQEILQRYARIKQVMHKTVTEKDPLYKTLLTEKLDNFLLDRFWGYAVLLVVLFLLFQSIFWLAQYPMNMIELGFSQLSNFLINVLPPGWLADLFVNGIIAGISGIAVFVPQIMILFGIITILEDTGYMARISFLSDRLMRQVGLNGKSVMPLISGVACAVPAIMSARSIENKKERLITIMVTPLMSCSARLPVYTILIALVIPDRRLFGVFSLQGLVMMGLYLLGFVMAMVVAYIMKYIIRLKEKSYFIMELPVYRAPRWKNVGVTMLQKSRVFVMDAGRVIIVIALILWFLASHGPSAQFRAINKEYAQQEQQYPQKADQIQQSWQTAKLQNSYAGILGRFIEPAIKPLGFDWKIGIALITSFAAREVFVGTMATLYSVGGGKDADKNTLREKMQAARNPDGTPVYTLRVGLSLMIFYVLAMQCMSTLAVVKRETRSWKFPVIQLAYMTGLAYCFSLLVYHIF